VNNNLSNNRVCNNTNLDFDVYNSVNTGNNNVCSNPDGWSDTGTTGCTLACSAPSRPTYLPLIMK
jgi:hypothetical protein